ncbi:uncharacterized protein STEHIDRAFT_147289 [Stereum hirsutum FP-91666 SS1]|uniref:uncharacterized protein n=1 Tax=Stereum hirsutum (strain FP-91666) TaxID=721885 RepID=UPI000444A7F2|nr:uncharacterized protein STEHIDRAFT_147289 [Stereum hirsutum FP-91666 SS1]EIM86819.1 hypothetical protein STEHIDRAFT_147289 [Stereum hirsutum FP-91666 SS1]
MHRALLIDELLRHIFTHLDVDLDKATRKRTFYQLARVCKAWRDPALDYLWFFLHQRDSEALFRLIPGLQCHHGIYTLDDSQELSLESLAKFNAYAKRVKGVCQYSADLFKVSPSLISRLQSCLSSSSNHSTTIFPSLTSVRLLLHFSLSSPSFSKVPLSSPLTLSLWLSPVLRSLSLELPLISRKPFEPSHPSNKQAELRAYLVEVMRVVPNLANLKLRGRISPSLMQTVIEMKQLKTLNLNVGGADMTPSAFVALSHWERLEELKVQMDDIDPEVLAALLPQEEDEVRAPYFPALKTLHIRASPAVLEAVLLPFTLPIVAEASAPVLHAIHISSPPKPRCIDSWKPSLALLPSTVEVLTLESLTTFCSLPSPAFLPLHVTPPPHPLALAAPQNPISATGPAPTPHHTPSTSLTFPSSTAKLHPTLSTFEPLSRLHNLRILRIDTCVPPDLGDEDVERMAGWWPKIEELGLWTRPMLSESEGTGGDGTTTEDEEDGSEAMGWLSPRATVASLRVLAERCPRLRGLAVPLDISSVSPSGGVAGQTTLERLTIGYSRPRRRPREGRSEASVDCLVEALYEAFPAMQKLAFECPGTEDGEGEDRPWKDVVDGYFALQQGSAAVA